MIRLRAALIHLGISIAIFVFVTSLLAFVWYPGPFFFVDGGWQGLRIAAAIDIVLGPCLTFVVFTANKPRSKLKFDLWVIGALQIAALLWGVHTIYQQRPYLLVYADGEFYTVRYSQLEGGGKSQEEIEALKQQANGRPPIIVVRPPKDEDEYIKLFAQVMSTPGGDFYLLTDRYEPLNAVNWPQIREKSVDLIAKKAKNPQASESLQQFLSKHRNDTNSISFFLVNGRFESCFVAFERQTGNLVGFLDVDPEDFE